MSTTHLLYLHGFRSSPQSAKAQLVAAWVRAHNREHPHAPIDWCCPQLPPSPREAMALIRQLTGHWPAQHMAVIGSSLGGFYATTVVRERDCRGWLINPAVHPARDLAAYLKQPRMPHPPEENHFFQQPFVEELQSLNPHPVAPWLTPQAVAGGGAPRLGLLVAKGDEVLDWREMHAAYAGHPGVHIRLLEGGDHTVSDFEQHLPEVLQFLQLTNSGTIQPLSPTVLPH